MNSSNGKRVYVIRKGKQFKVGISDDPAKRVKAFGPEAEVVYQSMPLENSARVERRIHSKLDDFWVGGEWFVGVSENDVMSVVLEVVSGSNDLKIKQYESYDGVEFVNVVAFGKISGFPIYLIRNWCRDGIIPCVRSGRVIKIPVRQALRVLEQRAAAEAEKTEKQLTMQEGE